MADEPFVPESYEASRDRFACERLRVLYYLGLVANPVFLAADARLYRDHCRSLLLIRLSLEAGLLLGFWGLIRRPAWLTPARLLMAWVLIGNLHIAAMTAVLGGFTSRYYNGLNLVFLAASVIVPISWTSHLTAQAVVLTAYYGING